MQELLLEDGYIRANKIILGERVSFGKGVRINVRGTFEVGSDSRIGDRFEVNAENVKIGKFFFNGPTDSRGMVIGGGGANFPFANLIIGDRVVCHTGHINLARSVTIGNDVGLSHDVDIITHGFWASVLDGYPNVFAEVNIGNNVIVGWKTVIMAGVNICDNAIIGAHSTVVKSLDIEKGIYGGTPAKLIKTVEPPTILEQMLKMNSILLEFEKLMEFYEVEPFLLSFSMEFPRKIFINNFCIDIETLTCEGKHTDLTDAFRDFLRRYGIRVFVEGRPFKFSLNRKPI